MATFDKPLRCAIISYKLMLSNNAEHSLDELVVDVPMRVCYITNMLQNAADTEGK